jgi:hypothetical protein
VNRRELLELISPEAEAGSGWGLARGGSNGKRENEEGRGRKARVLSQYGVQPDNQRYERQLRTHAKRPTQPSLCVNPNVKSLQRSKRFPRI